MVEAPARLPPFRRRTLFVLHLFILPMAAAVTVLIEELTGRSMVTGILAAWGVATLYALSAWNLLDMIGKAEAEKCFLDEQLIQSHKLAAIGELSSGVAHEINNPIAIIGQEAEWLKHLVSRQEPGEGASVEILDGVREIQKQVDRCKDITHKMLGLARKMEPVLQEADMSRLVEDMAVLVEKEALSHGVRIIRRYQKDLPRLCTDPPLLRQVALNLINNAYQAVGDNGLIEVSVTGEGRLVELRVSDNGPGIPATIQDKIFNPFFTTKPPGQGTGLGLSICHGIVTRLGGTIGVESEEGKGAAFIVRLPANTSCLKPMPADAITHPS